MVRRAVVMLVSAVLVRGAWGQEEAATKPAVDVSTPTAALVAYLQAEQKIDVAGMNGVVVVTPAYRSGYAGVVMNYEAWMH